MFFNIIALFMCLSIVDVFCFVWYCLFGDNYLFDSFLMEVSMEFVYRGQKIKKWDSFLCKSYLEENLEDGELDDLLMCIVDRFLLEHGYVVDPISCDYVKK